MAHGITYGEFEIEHPHSGEVHNVHVMIEYSETSGTHLDPPCYDWDYEIEWVQDEDGKIVTSYAWLTYELIKNKLDYIMSNI
jgi:hypothetical protein